jgi:hypothetical protein
MEPLSKQSRLPEVFGVFDLETYQDDKGIHYVYAGGYRLSNKNPELFYLEKGENGDSLLSRLFLGLIDSTRDSLKPRKGKTATLQLYAHNMAKFDGHFVITSLMKSGFIINPVFKNESTILYVDISHPDVPSIKITLRDSLMILPGSLEKLAKTFKTSFTKGIFPYKFMNNTTIYYDGPKPYKHFYNPSVSQDDYDNIPTTWSARNETLEYLRLDLETLFEVVTIHSRTVFDKYGVSIFNTLTVPSLAMKVFRTNFLGNTEIPYIADKADDSIRDGYYGGIVAAIKPEVKDGYYYDVNSAYPAAMMKDLPIGQPRLTTCSSLDNIFGMVRARVTAPATTINQVLPLPMRDANGKVVFEHGFQSTGY